MRYILFVDRQKHPIKREDINKNVLKEHKHITSQILKLAERKFRDIFGFELIELPAKASSKSK